MRWKWMVLIGALALVILIAGVYVYLNTYDYNKLKPLVTRMVADATGRELQLDGPINLAIGLAPLLVVTDVTFANAAWGSQPQMIKIKKLEAKVRLIPLLFKHVVLKHIGLEDVDILLETDSNGQGNWEFTGGNRSEKGFGAFEPVQIEIDRIRIENLRLVFHSTKKGSVERFNVARLAAAKQKTGESQTLDLRTAYNGQPIALSGTIGQISSLYAHQRFPLQLSGKLADTTFKIDGAIDDALNLQGIDVQAQMAGKNLKALGHILDIQLPETKAFDITGHLKGSKDALSLDDIKASLSGGEVDITFGGSVGNLMALSAVELQFKGSGKDLAVMRPLIAAKLPATDQFEITGRLSGSTEALALNEAKGSARRGSIRLSLSGAVKDLLNLKGMDLQSAITGTDLAELGRIIAEKLPATDQFELKGRLTGSAEALALNEAQGSARRDNINISVSGAVKDLLNLKGMDLQSAITGTDLAELGRIIAEKLPATDQFELKGRLTGSAEALALNEAQGSARRGSMNLVINGGITQLLALEGIDVALKASGKELAEIGELFGKKLPDLGPFNVSAGLSGSAKAISLNAFTAIIDQSDFKGLAKVEFRQHPKITLRLESSLIDFTALMKTSEKVESKTGDQDLQKSRLFSDEPLPFDVLKKVDADVLMKARNIRAKDAQFEFGYLTLKLENGDFSIDKLEATYKKTKISGTLHVDPGSPPQVATNFLVQNLNLGSLLKETGVSDQVKAIIDIAAEGKSRGNSLHSLMAQLDGSIGAVMGKGYLTKYLNLISINLTQKAMQIWGRHNKVHQIKCAVIQFDIKQGIAESQAFVFNTQAGTLTGEGQINLGTEEVNFLLVPKSKYPSLALSTKLRVTGTIMDAKVRPDNLALLTTGAEMLSSLAIGPLGLLTPFVHLGAFKKHPCDVKSIGQLGLETPGKKK
jgi:uncharacterized protein involved in outer membrane biogenesis